MGGPRVKEQQARARDVKSAAMHIVKLVFSAFATLAGPRQQGDAHYLAELWGTQLLRPAESATQTDIQVPTDNPTVCARVLARVAREHGIKSVVTGGGELVRCYVRLMQGKEERDLKVLGEVVPQMLKEEGAYTYPPRGLPLQKVRPGLLPRPTVTVLGADV